MDRIRTSLYTTLALVAFAANSILCRLALRGGSIDAASFTTIRFAAGAVTLLLVNAVTRSKASGRGSWPSAIALFAYAVAFSMAYMGLGAGTGSLILFGCVQVTMMSAAVWTGERPPLSQWCGLALAFGGLLYLVSPGLTAPPLAEAGLMALAGVAWGVYSLRGRTSPNPLADNTTNFVRAVPLIVAVNLLTLRTAHVQRDGALVALASGAVTTGLGYVVWYVALRRLTAARAGLVQLAVPMIAAAGGVMLLGEGIPERLLVSAALVLGGIGMALIGRARRVA